ncbi:MAG: 4-hydroxy-tetrahydrodipicolinate reductase [Synergistaceae bacterium]
MIKVMLHGCKGRMGQVLENFIASMDNMTVVCGVDMNVDGSESYPTFKNPCDCDIPCDVVIDFSNYKAVPSLIDYCLGKKLPLVIATTSLGDETEVKIKEASKEIPVFYSFNMSLGVNVIADVLAKITPILEKDFDVEIIEKHHNQKKDSPSGTALLLADAVNEGCAEKKEYIFGRHGREDAPSRDQIGIHSVRGGTIPGEHTVIYAGSDEIIEIKHTALSRSIFAKGAIKAAEFIANKKSGLFTMRQMVSGN